MANAIGRRHDASGESPQPAADTRHSAGDTSVYAPALWAWFVDGIISMTAVFATVIFEQTGWCTWNPECIEGCVRQNAKWRGCYDSTRRLSGYLHGILLATVPAQGKRDTKNFGTVNLSCKRDSSQDFPRVKHECTLQMFSYRNKLAMHKLALLIRILKILGSDLARKAGCIHIGFSWFSVLSRLNKLPGFFC